MNKFMMFMVWSIGIILLVIGCVYGDPVVFTVGGLLNAMPLIDYLVS